MRPSGKFPYISIAVVVLLVNAAIAYRSALHLMANDRLVSHTYEVIGDLEQLISSLKDAETGNRGFIITGDENYLQPYNDSVGRVRAQVDRVRALTSDNPAQQAHFPQLEAHIDNRLALLRRSIELRRGKGFAIAQEVVQQGAGKAEMDAIREIINSMEQEESKLLEVRRQEARSSGRRTLVTFGVATGLALVFLLLISRLLRYEQRLRTEAETNALRLQKVQTVSDAALAELSGDRLIDELMMRLRDVLNTDTATLLLMNPDGHTLAVRASQGIDEQGVSVRVGEGFAGRVAETKQAFLIEDVERADIKNRQLRESLTTLMGVPLRVENKIIGVLHVGRHQHRGFSESDQILLQMVADRMAIAVDRGAAYDAEAHARKELAEKAREVMALNQELESRVRLRTVELETANRELEAFSYSVSHDLRAPLRTLDGFSQAVLEDYSAVVDETGKDYLNRIRAASQRMGQLIDALLQLSRVTRADLRTQEVNLSRLAERVTEDLRRGEPHRNVEVRIQPELHAVGDPGMLEVALQNLIGNAWKFTSRRPGAVIEFGRVNGDGPAFYVRDNGAGFNMQYADKLFSAFHRLHGDSQFKGSGIGLATVQRIIRRHHGRIWAEAVEGEGSTFYFELGA